MNDSNVDDSVESDEETIVSRKHRTTRSGRVSKPYDFKKNFPETAHVQVDKNDGRCLRPHYYDDEKTVEQLVSGMHYENSYFSENVTARGD